MLITQHTLLFFFSVQRAAGLPVAKRLREDSLGSSNATSPVYLVRTVGDTSDELLQVLNLIGAFLVIVSVLKYLELLDTNYCIKLMLTYFYPTTSFLLKHLKYTHHDPRRHALWRPFLGNNIAILLLNVPLLWVNPVSPVLRRAYRAGRRLVRRATRLTRVARSFRANDSEAFLASQSSSICSKLDQEDAADAVSSSSLNDLKELFAIFSTNRTLTVPEPPRRARAELETLRRYIALVKDLLIFLKNNFPVLYECYLQHSSCARCGGGAPAAAAAARRLQKVEQHGLVYVHLERFVLKGYVYYYLNYVVLVVAEELVAQGVDLDSAVFFVHNTSAYAEQLARTAAVRRRRRAGDAGQQPVLEQPDVFRVIRHEGPDKAPYNYLIEVYVGDDVHMRPFLYRAAEDIVRMDRFEVYTRRPSSKTTTGRCRRNGRLVVARVARFLAQASHPKTHAFTSKFRGLTIRRGRAVEHGEYYNVQELHRRVDRNFTYALESETTDPAQEEEFAQTHRHLVELLMVFADRMVFFRDYEWALLSLDFGGYCWLLVLKTFPDLRRLFFTRAPQMGSRELSVLVLEKLAGMHFHERSRFLTLPVVYNPHYINVTSDLGSVSLYDFMLASEEATLGLSPRARDDTFVASIYHLYKSLH